MREARTRLALRARERTARATSRQIADNRKSGSTVAGCSFTRRAPERRARMAVSSQSRHGFRKFWWQPSAGLNLLQRPDLR
jgi:hypothetical protein